jgi:hypothetical protein
MMNHQFLPDIARKYDCGLVDIRNPWLEYLRVNHYEPMQLLVKDGAHLNVQGNFLLAALTSRYLVYRSDLPDTQWKALTHEQAVDAGMWKDGKLALDFDGNRVDLIAASDAPVGGRAQILIDGKKPSEFPGAYRITRPTPGPWSPVFLSRVDHDSPLILEDWSLKISHVSPDGHTWDFDIAGSITGPDGSGKSDQPFTSQSGRVKIEPAAWFRGFYLPLPNGTVVRWKVLPMFLDEYQATKTEDPTKENAATVIQGIPNGRHTLEIIAEDSSQRANIALIRAYRPHLPFDP